MESAAQAKPVGEGELDGQICEDIYGPPPYKFRQNVYVRDGDSVVCVTEEYDVEAPDRRMRFIKSSVGPGFSMDEMRRDIVRYERTVAQCRWAPGTRAVRQAVWNLARRAYIGHWPPQVFWVRLPEWLARSVNRGYEPKHITKWA